MCSLLTVAQGLIKIFELREAIRHQRRVNKQTYLHLTEIHVELQYLDRSGALETGNATLTRNASVKKFALAVHHFVKYLEKYNAMHRIVRVFKRSEMEAERLLIVAEVEQLFRMLGLATSVTLLNAKDSMAKNASTFLAKLQDVHSDVKLTHDQVQAALLGLVEKRKQLEAEKDVVTRKPTLTRSTEPSFDDFSVPRLMETLTSYPNDLTLLLLIRQCVTNQSRRQIYQANGIPQFTHLIQHTTSFYTQVYALHCLSWFTFLYAQMSDTEFETLRQSIREATIAEIQALGEQLQDGKEQDKEDAAILCSCLATRGDGNQLRNAGLLTSLVTLVNKGTGNQKLWAAEALGTLASNNDDNCVAIAQEGAIPPLVALLRSGSDMQRQEAAYALGNLAADNDAIRATISREGAIPPMVSFMSAVTDAQNQWAVYALGALSLNNEANRVAIAQEGAIGPLVSLLYHGTDGQKQWATYTLGNLAYNDDNRVKITLQGAMAPLITLLQSGTDAQKLWATYALGNLACENDALAQTMALDDVIPPLVELVRAGSDPQKQEAAYTLGNLAANNDDIRDEIGRKRVITPLVKLLQRGNSDQRQWACYALACIAQNHNTNREFIIQEGAIGPLGTLAISGTEEQKAQALRALEHLADLPRDSAIAFPSNQVITLFMGFLQSGTNVQKTNAAIALRRLASCNSDNCNAILRNGVIPLLKGLVDTDTGTETQKKAAMVALDYFRQHMSPTEVKVGELLRTVAMAW